MKTPLLKASRFAGLLTVSLFLAGCHRGFGGGNGSPGPEYAAIIERLTKEGVPTTPARMQEPMPAEGDNAGPIYLQVADAINDKRYAADVAILETTGGWKSILAEEQYAEIEAALSNRADLMNLIHSAAQKKGCALVKDFSDPIHVTFPELAAMRSSARQITAESLAMAHAGHAVEAVKNQALVFNIAKHAGQEHTLISLLVRIACNAIALDGMQKIVYLSQGDAEVAGRMAEEIQEHLGEPDLQAAWKKERGFEIQVFEKLRRDGPDGLKDVDVSKQGKARNISSENWNGFVDHNGIVLQKRMDRVVAACKKPLWQAMPELSKIDAEAESGNDPQAFLASMLLADTTSYARKAAQNNALVAVTRLGAKLIVYRAKHGSYPSALRKIESPEPVDPTNGKRYGYSREGDGFVVYSTGADGDFDGGEPGTVKGRFDALFRYPLPAYVKVGVSRRKTQ